jgi:hypothetical protein
MGNLKIILLGTGLSALASYGVLACSSPNTGSLTGGPGSFEQTGTPSKKDAGAKGGNNGGGNNGNENGGNNNGGNNNGGNNNGGNNGGTQSDGGTTPTNACAASTTRDECGQCCDEQNPAAVDAWGALWDACVCAPTACATQCGTSYCGPAGDAPTAECSDCISANTSACTTKANTACPGDTKCAPLTACETASQCKNKP